MISDLNRSLGSRQFLNVANERTCFASCACARAFKVAELILVPRGRAPFGQHQESRPLA